MAPRFSMFHDLKRSLKNGKPFLLMESSPGPTNWMEINRLLRPGQHRLKSLQAVAHGSDGVCYFQIRKGRGGSEKFHGAVIDHIGNEDNRMFREVSELGADLKKLDAITGAKTPAKVGIIYDWESRWMLDASNGPSKFSKDHDRAMLAHYTPFWKMGIPVDFLNGDSDLDGYSIVIAPQLYMLREGFAERVEKLVNDGGKFIATYLTGIANETDLVFSGGLPGPLRKVLGILSEEIDYIYEDERNSLKITDNAVKGLEGSFTLANVCDVIRTETAETIGVYTKDFYAGHPALTRNRFGKGEAWYIAAASADGTLLDSLYSAIVAESGLSHSLPDCRLPDGVTAQMRVNGGNNYIFVMNFNNKAVELNFAKSRTDMLSGDEIAGNFTLPAYGVLVLADR
jgi:beta-galactosidase